MTPTADTSQHPEVSEISDLTEGLLAPSRSAEVQQHLAECDLCAEVRDSLEEIRELLGTVPDPEPMPEDIAARIDAALAAEARPTLSTDNDPVVVSRETTTGDGAEASRPAARSASGTGSATAPDRPAGRPSATTGPGRRHSRRRRRTVVLGTAFGAAVIGMSVFFLQSLTPSDDASTSVADRGFSAADSSAPAYADATLENQVRDLLGDEATQESQESPGARKVPPEGDIKSSGQALTPEAELSRSPMKAPAVAVPPCVQKATGRTTPALALEEGTYRGTDAYLVVLPHRSDPSRVQAYVVASSCVDAAPESSGQLLLTRSYNRP
ncbi:MULTISPECIES: anti-sigma factor family protein [unclassified Streptomyces]|uniref:anti-sigma factor family protein n=1 Tax=unclassified Streptomyces TaxID=2593676 RepID=UPI0036BDF659